MPLRLLLDNDTQLDGPWMVRKPGVTEAEFFRLAGEDDRWELIDGDLIMHSPATPEHGSTVAFLTELVRSYVHLRDAGEVYDAATTIHLGTGRILAADLSFLSHARAEQEKRRWVEAPMDWVCEVGSPSTLSYDLGEFEKKSPEGGGTGPSRAGAGTTRCRGAACCAPTAGRCRGHRGGRLFLKLGEKLDLYKEHGFGEVWVFDPAGRCVHVSAKHGRRYTDRVVAHGRIESAVLPGFWIDSAWLWKRPLPGGIACLKRILGVERL